jgi:hypothetical protein
MSLPALTWVLAHYVLRKSPPQKPIDRANCPPQFPQLGHPWKQLSRVIPERPRLPSFAVPH